MNYKKINKNCIKRGKGMIKVDIKNLHCDECKKENIKIIQENHHINYYKPKYTEKEYFDNFIQVVDNPFKLTITGFNEYSKIKVQGYRNYFKLAWIDFLKKYYKDEYNLLYKYILEEYTEYHKTYKLQDVSKFCKQHKYITYKLVEVIGINDIMNDCNVIKNRYTDKDYENNFNNIVKQIGRVPIFIEFREYSKITDEAYAQRFGFKRKVYNQIVKKYTTENQYNEYLQRRLEHKTKIGKQTCNMNKNLITDEELKNSLIQIFNEIYNKYGKYPSRRYFDIIADHDSSIYRKFYQKSWSNICKMFGYKITREANFSERFVLKTISNILQEEYIPQKSWNWLLSNKNGRLRCDGYFFENNLVIEFDGVQHRIPMKAFGGEEYFKQVQENDRIKNDLVPKHGIKLLRIDSREKWFNEEYLKQKLIKIGMKIPNNSSHSIQEVS